MGAVQAVNNQAPAGYQYAPQPTPWQANNAATANPGTYIPAAPSPPSNYTQTGGGTQGTTYSPIWAANQTQQQFNVGQGALQGVAGQLQQLIQQISQMAAKPQGMDKEAAKQEAAQVNAGGVNSAQQQLTENAAALGQASGSPGLGQAQAQVANQGAQNLQSAYTDINDRDAQLRSQNVATALQSLLSLMGVQAGVAGNIAQHGQQQQFPVLSGGAGGGGAAGPGGTVTGPNRTGQYGAQGTGLTLQGQDAVDYTNLTSRPFETLAGWERIRLMQLRDKLGY